MLHRSSRHPIGRGYPISEGARVEIKRTYRDRAILFALAMASVLGLGWANDYASCQRVQKNRQAQTLIFQAQESRLLQRASFDTGRARQLDIGAARAYRQGLKQLHPEGCLSVLPPT